MAFTLLHRIHSPSYDRCVYINTCILGLLYKILEINYTTIILEYYDNMDRMNILVYLFLLSGVYWWKGTRKVQTEEYQGEY